MEVSGVEDARVREAQAPSWREMLPFSGAGVAERPVYPDLEERLLSAERHPDGVIAHVLAVCSAYAYADSEAVSMIMARLGLSDNLCRRVELSVDAMFIHSTGFVVQSRSGRVAILCYRGTQPLNLLSWLVSLDLEPERLEYGFGGRRGTVHGGFYRNTRATRYKVMNILEELDDRLEALYVTGHSLGGAMASLMGVMIRHEDRYRKRLAGRLKAVYTFGQPMVGDPGFADSCREDPFLDRDVIRYIHGDDVIPHLPPASSGPYRHFGREFRYRTPSLQRLLPWADPVGGRREWREQSSPTGQVWGLSALALAGTAFFAGKFRLTRSLPSLYSIDDHFPRRYITALTPEGVPNEYGP